MRTFWKVSIGVVALGAAGAAAWWGFAAPEPPSAPNTVAVTRGNIEETVLASGILQASQLVSVGAQTSGIVKSVNVALGDAVTAGEVIAEIDSLDQQNALQSAQASLASAEAQRTAQQTALLQAERALSRASDMRSRELLAQSELEVAEANVTNARAQLAALDAQIELASIAVQAAELDLSRTTITSPISGTVVAVLVEQGQTVSAAQTAPTIVKIANLDSMLIKAEISEADVTRVAPGQRVYFTVLGSPDDRIEATLKSIDPAPSSIAAETAIDASTAAVYYNGIFEVPNPDHALRISMTAQVTIVIDEARDALIVPSSALRGVRRRGQGMVEVYDPVTGSLAPREVLVGLDNNVSAAILTGVSEGELVVATGGARPVPGTGGPGGGFRPGGGQFFRL
jgi:macrolide-specific efflux system membrane fusion protein